MRKHILVIAVLAVGLATGLCYFMSTVARTSAVPETGVTVGKTAPALTAQTLDGKMVKIEKSGKIAVLNFWATWCPPCRYEMPELETFAVKHGDTIVFAAINLQEPAEKVKQYLEQNKYTMPVLLDKDGTAAAGFSIRAIPTTIVLDQNGVIRYRKSGAVTADELETVLKDVQAAF